jgi:hypothetical protein
MSIERDFENVDQTIPDSFPVLDAWLEQQSGRKPLAGVTALLIQHQFGNQVPQARALLELGLDPQRLHWLDIPYTSTPAVRKHLISKLGIPEKNFSVSDYRVLEPYAPYQHRRVQRLLKAWLQKPPERLVVLDDGAYFLEAMASFQARLPSVAVVEQTTRGFIKVNESAVLRRCLQVLPVVNVAQSSPKQTLEPPFIGLAVCASLRQRLQSRARDFGKWRCLVLGFGAIGRQVAKFLHNNLGFARENIHAFDKDAAKLADARSDGFAIWNRDDFGTRFRLVIGCSGRASFGIGDSVYLEKEDAVLASASSGSVELSRQEFIDLADSSDLDDIEVLREGLDETNIHSDLRFRLVDREATFLNAGFPVNFVGQINCVPCRYIQPTATMMVAATVQAVQEKRRGEVPLDRKFCQWIDAAFRKELGGDATILPPKS